MQRHFQEEIETLKLNLIKMASLAESSIDLAVKAIIGRDATLAESIIAGDGRINALEMEIDNSIIDLLALQQPVASDLRLILAAQKINNDLERIGDHGVNLAESAVALAGSSSATSFLMIPRMAEFAKAMLRDAIDGFIHNNPDLANKVLRRDDEVDNLNRATASQAIDMIKLNQQDLEAGLDLIRVSRNLERVADLATNIAEEVIFIAHARVVKHHLNAEL